jgi:hypothetical protein
MSDPKLIANFVLDSAGKPKSVERNGIKHYFLRLGVEDLPEDAYAVTYKLDESYYDPIRESRERADSFAEELTSYGDYVVQAKVRSKQGVEPIAENLSRALEIGHAGNRTPEIEAALEEIKAR